MVDIVLLPPYTTHEVTLKWMSRLEVRWSSWDLAFTLFILPRESTVLGILGTDVVGR